MSVTRIVTENRRDQLLENAVRRQVHVVLNHRMPEGWRTYRARFGRSSQANVGLIASVQAAYDEHTFSGPPVGEIVGVTFRMGHKKCMCSTTVQQIERSGDSWKLVLAWPRQIQQLQRRAYERALPPSGRVIAIRFWLNVEHAQDRIVRHGQLEDISAGGMRVTAGEGEPFQLGGTYECIFSPRSGTPTLALEVTLKHCETTDRSRVSLGFHFIGLETAPDGQRQLDRLARLVSQFQRAAADPHR